MAAPKGNQFWKLAQNAGRPKLFETPEALWKAACDYFDWCDKNPWHRHEAVKSGDMVGTTVEVPVGRPYTLSGFALFIGASESYWREFRKAKHKEFLSIIEAIETAIYTQKFEGAAVGAFNANIIARDLGLKEHTDMTTKGESVNKSFYDLLKFTAGAKTSSKAPKKRRA